LAEAVLVSRWDRGYWFMGTTAYFDESGVDRSHRIAVVAGFVASTKDWIAFEVAWKKQMAQKPPRMKWKKYVQAECVPFARIAREFSMKAINCPCDHKAFEFIIGSSKNDFVGRLDNIYSFCSRWCCQILDNLVSEREMPEGALPVKVVFDKGSEHERSLDRGYTAYYGSAKDTRLCGCPIFDNDETILPLQAAHLFAWLLSKHYNLRKPEKEALRIIGSEGHATQPILN
jgi:Protein of unknown function (DUF3800)